MDEEEFKIGIRTRYDPSNNYDPYYGNYSIEVIKHAFKMTNLELISVNSDNEHALAAKQDHTTADAYIFNIRLSTTINHWFGIRKFDEGWFNLDSRLYQPEFLAVHGPKIDILSRSNIISVPLVVEREYL